MRELSDDDVAFACAYGMIFDEQSDAVRRVRTALDLLDLTVDKRDVFQTAAQVVELHQAVFRGLLGGYQAVYGDLQPAEALMLPERLRLPADAEGLADLKDRLRKGAKNHYG